MSELLFVPPEWVLLVGDPASIAPLERALTAESVTVRVASERARFDRLLQLGRPAAAAVDLDHPLGAEAASDLAAQGVLLVVLSSELNHLRRFKQVAPIAMHKPVTPRAFLRAVDSLLGRR
ncbi:MAG: hypothetical protein RMM58_02675 [Chloroflexota bacterium]|nr:hypothetical protein [Dehalococcoidia bacterium]MDW8252761.1 hypothetical protein [Chloroflexota bacterium]